MFTAEETYVRRTPADAGSMADLWEEATRLDSASQGSAGIRSFTVEGPSEEMIAARASRLVGPIAQQLALLGPSGWDRFAAVFSCTVSGEVAQLRFWSGRRSTEVRVPEEIAVLVRRQRHLAARMPAGPWWRLLLTVGHGGGQDARITTDYDYGDEPFPDDDLLAPAHYRNDLAAYPRPQTPAWLVEHIAGADGPGTAPRTAAQATGATVRTTAPVQDRPAPPPRQESVSQPGPAQPGPGPVLDVKYGRTRLHADPQVITYGRKSMALDQVEWVGYTATHTATKRFLYPTTHDSTWEFVVGRYPYYGGPKVAVSWSKGGRRAEQPEEWTFLVNLSQRYLEPRLLTELVAQVRSGRTVTLGGSVQVNQAGIACRKPRRSLRWESFSGTQLNNGMVCIYQAGVEKPRLTVPLSHPNAALSPGLFALLTS
jgi:hypothetical protein